MKPRLPFGAFAAIAGLVGLCGTMGLASVSSCQTYEPPPTAALKGLENGVLANSLDPLVLEFSTPIDPSTVSVEVALFDIDSYGNLPDEIPDGGPLDVYLSHTPNADTHVSATFSADNTTLTLVPTPPQWLPVGPSLVLLVLPGLTSATTGTVLNYRQRIPFSYAVACGGGHTTDFHSGAYFFLLQVNKPLGVELKAFAAIDVDPKTGAFSGQFTAALRNSDPSRCKPACTGGDVCQLIPTEACVQMSTPPTSVDEWPDYVPKATAPNGYTFAMHGCAVDEVHGAVDILTAPGVLNVTSPDVSIQGLTFTAQFAPTDGGVVLGSGSLTATQTLLGKLELGAGAGTLTAVSIPAAEAPPGLPQPSAPGVAGDAGVDSGSSRGSEGGS
jgi:hypothetical protein